MSDRLKLRARDEDDLTVLAGILQDAIVPVADMAFLPTENQFVFVANRFRWEGDGSEGAGPWERVNCGVVFEGVNGVKSHGIDLDRKEEMLSLLTLGREPGTIQLVFAGGARIRLDAPDIRCRLDDLGEAWPTQWRPLHAAGDE